MPHGFFTIEQWKRPRGRTAGRWVPILHLDAYQTPTKALEVLAQRKKPGLFRILQTQRCIWAEMENGTVRLHGSHLSSAKSLAQLAKMFDREGGRRPVEKARRDRARAKAARLKQSESRR